MASRTTLLVTEQAQPVGTSPREEIDPGRVEIHVSFPPQMKLWEIVRVLHRAYLTSVTQITRHYHDTDKQKGAA